MRHNKSGRKLGRNSTHKRAMMRNMATSLFRYGSIQTTLPKAKEIRPYAEKLITRAIDASLADIRIVLSKLTDRSVAHHLVNDIAPHFKDRKGGYLRIIKLGQRKGDGAEMAIIELISEDGDKKETKRRKKSKKQDATKAEEKSKKQESSAKNETDLHEDHEKSHPREEQTKEHLTPGSKAEGTRRSSKPPKRSVPKQSSVNRGTSTPKTPPPASQDK